MDTAHKQLGFCEAEHIPKESWVFSLTSGKWCWPSHSIFLAYVTVTGVPHGDTGSEAVGVRTEGSLQQEQGPVLRKRILWGLRPNPCYLNLSAGLKGVAHRTCILNTATGLGITCSQCLKGPKCQTGCPSDTAWRQVVGLQWMLSTKKCSRKSDHSACQPSENLLGKCCLYSFVF